MHHRESYLPPDAPRRPRRRRAAILTAAALSLCAVTGVSSVLATAHERPRIHRSASSSGWTMPAIERPVPEVVMTQKRWRHRSASVFQATLLGVPPVATAPPSTAPSPVAEEPTAGASPSPAAEAGRTLASASSVGGAAAGSVQRLFSAASPWNTPISSDASTDPESASIVSQVLNNRSLVVNLNMYAFGIPFYTATASTPRVQVRGTPFSDAVPLDPSWQPNEGGDHKMNVIDPSTGTVFELQGFDAGARSVQWAVKKDYRNSLADGYPEDGNAGPTGSGLTQSGGVVRMAEIEAGRIDHALSFITSNPTGRFRYPASHSDGEAGSGLAEGMRVQLDPSLDVDAIPGITPGEKTIAKALQQYGAFCTDTGRNNNQAMGIYVEKPKAGDKDPYPAAGFPQDWAQLPHIPRDRLRVLAADATPRPS